VGGTGSVDADSAELSGGASRTYRELRDFMADGWHRWVSNARDLRRVLSVSNASAFGNDSWKYAIC